MQRYQDAVRLDGIDAGERDCRPRWDLIERHLPRSGVIVDVGSNLGYYTLSAVRSRPDVAVVSIEADPGIARRQAELLQEHDTRRVCLVQGAMGSAVAAQWAQTCDWVQATLLLSVLHWMDDPAAVVRDLSSISEVLIAEVPDARDTGACGHEARQAWTDPVAWFAATTGRDVALLGRMSRHTSDVPSHLLMVTGPVSRRPSVPYWGARYERAQPRRYAIEFDGSSVSLAVGAAAVAYRPGINLVTLMSLGKLVHPGPEWWIDRVDSAIELAPRHGDPLPHNMLWDASGVSLIDGDDLAIETPAGTGRASIRRNVTAWARNRTASPFAYVADRPVPWRIVRHTVGRLLRATMGDEAIERFKARFGLYGAHPR